MTPTLPRRALLDEEAGTIRVRINDFRDQVEVHVGRFDQMTFDNIIAYLTDQGYVSKDECFFGCEVTAFNQEIPESMMKEPLAYFEVGDGATLSVRTGRPSTRDEVEAIWSDIDICNLNFNLDDQYRLEDCFDFDEHGMLLSVDLSDMEGTQLTSLPESFGQLRVGGNLDLNSSQLTRLPESFGHLRVGGNLYLSANPLTTLPESFGQLRVGRDLYLSHNQLTTLPESFGQLRVSGDLDLYANQLILLPESFGQLRVGGTLNLMTNRLTSLPESFGQLRVGGDLVLSVNQLASLPESFGQLRVGGDLYLNNNELTTLPESFGQLEVGGNLNLSDNPLSTALHIHRSFIDRVMALRNHDRLVPRTVLQAVDMWFESLIVHNRDVHPQGYTFTRQIESLDSPFFTVVLLTLDPRGASPPSEVNRLRVVYNTLGISISSLAHGTRQQDFVDDFLDGLKDAF